MHTVHISKTKWLELATNSKVRPNGGQSNKCVITLEREKKKKKLIFAPFLSPEAARFFGQHQKSRPLTAPNAGSLRFTDLPSFCTCSESNRIGSGLKLLCLQSHSKPECHWTWPEVAILGADQKERGL